ncbi:MAG: energy-coupling factor transporter transmembrane protein EcfT [Spirochaetaceae bacterium]|jgi:energy-coupling factor transporter transmembrane protein EcfT|nr:energy-coupling factor transporter transmembrane protein EcfT [Spirochaetaceae bacterium]
MAVTPFSYRPAATPLHRINAGVKLLCLLVFSAAAFAESMVCSAVLGAGLVMASLRAGINPLSLLRGSRPVAVLGLFVALGRAADFSPPYFDAAGFFSGLQFVWSMLLSFCGGALLFAVTTMTELREAVSAAESALLRPVAALLKNSKTPRLERLRAAALYPRTALALSLMMGFIPRFFAEWEALQNAYLARGGSRGIACLSRLVPLATARMIDRAEETAAALEARGLKTFNASF